MKSTISVILIFLIGFFNMLGDSPKVTTKFLKKTTQKLNSYSSNREKKMQKYLIQFDKKQEKLFNRLCKINPNEADALYRSWYASKQRLNRSMNAHGKNEFLKPSSEYSSYSDTLLTAVNYLGDDKSKSVTEKYKDQLDNEQLVKEYMQEQKSIMKNLVSEVPDLKKYYKGLSKNEYYFVQNGLDFDNLFSNSNKLEKNIFSTLKNDDGFSKFVSQNSGIHDFGSIPDSWGKSLEGLQTNQMVSGIQKGQLKSFDSLGIAKVLTNIFNSKQIIAGLKEKGVSSAADLPEFTPNPYRTKSLFNRLNFGYDFQLANPESQYFLPSGAICGLMLKYNINRRLSSGAGISYSLSFRNYNKEIKNYRDNMSIRIFTDYGINKVLFLTASVEERKSKNSTTGNHFEVAQPIDIKYLAGIKLKIPVSTKLSCTSSLLYCLNGGREGDLAIRFGFEY